MSHKSTEFQKFLSCLEIPKLGIHALDFALGMSSLPKGIMMEFGVWNGTSITKMANAHPERHVFGFDSFEGLPETWDREDGAYEPGRFSLKGRLPHVPKNVQLIKGWFCDTLPGFVMKHKDERVAFLHVDCDLYSSTCDIFKHLEPLFQDEMILVFDELVNYPGYERHEILAFHEFLSAHPEWNVEWIGCLGGFIGHTNANIQHDPGAQ